MTGSYSALGTKNPGDQIDADMYNAIVGNDDFFRNPPQASYAPAVSDPNITTSSSSMVDLTGFSVTFTSQGNNVRIEFSARANGTTARFDFLVDGVSVTGDNDGLGAPGATGFVNISRVIAVSAGSHTYKVQWRSTSGTVTVYPASLPQLTVREV